MKRYILAGFAIGLLLAWGTVAMAGITPGTGIRQTAHDLSSHGGNTANFYGDTTEQAGKDRICVFCHAPHHTANATTDGIPGDFDYLPLWNHAVTGLAGGYLMYQNGTYDAGLIDHNFNGEDTIGQPGGVSLLCLSCHDGNVAVNLYGTLGAGRSPSKGPGAGGARTMTGRALIGDMGDLTNHHPIGFDYDDTLTGIDREIRLITTLLPVNNGNNGGVHTGGPSSIGDLLVNNRMECITCHDVHNTKNGGSKFTWVDDKFSNLCFTCHVKDGTQQSDTYVPEEPVGY